MPHLRFNYENEFLFNIQRGFTEGVEVLTKFSLNSDVSKTAQEDIWSKGGIYNYLSAAVPLEIKSSAGSDNITGTGARKIKVLGLDENFLEIEEEVNMSGTGTVITTQSFIRVYRAFVTEVGSAAQNNGLITIQSGTNVLAQIEPDLGKTLMSQYTIPANKTAYLFAVWMNSVKVGGLDPDDGELFLFIRPFGGMFLIERHYQVFPNNIKHGSELIPFMPIAPKSDIVIRAIGENNNIRVSAGYSLLLVDNKFVKQ